MKKSIEPPKSIQQQMHDATLLDVVRAEVLGMAPDQTFDEKLIADLKSAIEALANEERPVMWSKTAYTSRRTVHKTFCNGAERQEGRHIEETVWSKALVEDVITAQRVAIIRYRESIEGPVDLVWRCEPEIRRSEEGVSVYTRLCFEPSIVEVAKGVWVNVNLQGNGW